MEILSDVINEIKEALHLTPNGTYILLAFEQEVLEEVWRENLRRETPTYFLNNIIERCKKYQEETLGKEPNWKKYYFVINAYGIDKGSSYQSLEFVKKLLAPKKEFVKKKVEKSEERPPLYDLLEAIRLYAFIKLGNSSEFLANRKKIAKEDKENYLYSAEVNPYYVRSVNWAREELLPLFKGKSGYIDVFLDKFGSWNIYCSDEKITQEDYMVPFLKALPVKYSYPLLMTAESRSNPDSKKPFKGKMKFIFEEDVNLIFAVSLLEKEEELIEEQKDMFKEE